MSYEGFISYRRQGGKELAHLLHNKLKAHKLPIFLDNDELHFGDFRRQLIRNNLNSRVLILLLSPGALDRCKNRGDWVGREISLFLRLHKKIIVVKYKDFEFPDDLARRFKKLKNAEQIEYDNNADEVAEKIADILQKKWNDDDYISFNDFYENRYNDKYNLTLNYKAELRNKSKDKFLDHFRMFLLLMALVVLFVAVELDFFFVTVVLFFFNIYMFIIKRKYKNINYHLQTDTLTTLGYMVKAFFIALLAVIGGIGLISAIIVSLSNLAFLAPIWPDDVELMYVVFGPMSIAAFALSINLILKLLIYTPMYLNTLLSKYLCAIHKRHRRLQKVDEHPYALRIISFILGLIIGILVLIKVPFK